MPSIPRANPVHVAAKPEKREQPAAGQGPKPRPTPTPDSQAPGVPAAGRRPCPHPSTPPGPLSFHQWAPRGPSPHSQSPESLPRPLAPHPIPPSLPHLWPYTTRLPQPTWTSMASENKESTLSQQPPDSLLSWASSPSVGLSQPPLPHPIFPPPPGQAPNPSWYELKH